MRFLSCIEIFCFGVTVCNAFWGWGMTKGILLCFVVEISIMLSGKSFSGKIKNRFIIYMGKFSMPIYICHWTVGTAIYFLYSRIGLGIPIVYFSYYMGTFLFALLLYNIIEESSLGRRILKDYHCKNRERK